MKKLLISLIAVLASVSTFADSWERCKSVSDLTSGGTFIIGYEATAKSGEIIPMLNTGGTATTTAAGYMAAAEKAVDMSKVTATDDYEFKIVASTKVTNAVCIKCGDNFIGNTDTKNNLKLFASESANTAYSLTVGTNDVFKFQIAANKSYTHLQYNTNSPRFAVYGGTQKDLVVYKKKITTIVPVTGVSITDKDGNALGYSVNLTETETMQLKAAVAPTNATEKDVTWSVLQDSVVVSVSESGLVTALKPGLAAVVVTTKDGEKQASVYVNVTEPQQKTIAQFLESKGGICYLTGTVSDIVNTEYGNFTLTDESGSIYVYGCLTPDGEKKQFSTLDVSEGDVIKVLATEYKLYNEVEEAVNVVFVENYGAPAPPVTFEITTGAEDFTVTPSDTEATYYVELQYGSLEEVYQMLADYGMTKLEEYYDYLLNDMGSNLDYVSGVQTQSYEDDWYLDLEEDAGDYTIVAFAVDENHKRISEVFTKEFTITGPSEDEIAANQFKQDHAAILEETVETVDSDDKAAVKAALEDYDDLSVGAQALLAEEKELLDALYATIGWNEAEEALDELMDDYEDLVDDRVAMILLKSDEKLSSEFFDKVVPQVEQLEDLMEQGKQTGTPTPDEYMALLEELSEAIANLHDEAMELYPTEAGDYADVIIELFDAKEKYDALNEEYKEVRDDLKLTNLWNRVTDQYAAEVNRLNWDLENNPEPSDLRLAFHYANINLIRLNLVVFEEAAKQHMTKDEKIQSLLDAIIKLVSSRNTMAAQYGALVEDDAEWQAISARLDIEEAAVNALADPTLEELNAHEAELAAINAAMQAYAAKLEAGVTGISTMQKAEGRMQNIYNFAGQKVDANYRGIVIKNGKKVMVK